MAQISVDMNQITCEGWLGYTPEQRDFVRFWMSGYYNAAANSNVLNDDRPLSGEFRKSYELLRDAQVTIAVNRDQEPRLVAVRDGLHPGEAVGSETACDARRVSRSSFRMSHGLALSRISV